MTEQVKKITNSELRSFKECRRRWWLAHVRKLRIKKKAVTGPAPLGTRVHKALEAYYAIEGVAGREAALARLEALRDKEIEDNVDVVEEIRKEHELACTMVEGYCDWLEETGADSELEIVATEMTLEAPSPVENVNLLGKLDLVAKHRGTGDLVWTDFKTVADLTTPLKTIHLDEQFKMYALIYEILRKNSDEPGLRHQVWTGLKKVKRSSRANPPFYARHEVYISDADLKSFWVRLHGEITDLLRVEEELKNGVNHQQVAYPTPSRDCPWKCEFFNICGMFDDENSDVEGLLESLYEEKNTLERYNPVIG
jgi:hypothetical protein